MNQELEMLCDDKFIRLADGINNVSVIREIFSKRHEVKTVRDAIFMGALTFEDIKKWVSFKLQDLKPGTKFSHDLSFGALSVVLERVPTNEADNFIRDLAGLDIQEMPISRYIALESLKYRLVNIASNKVSEFNIQIDVPQIEEQLKIVTNPLRVSVSNSEHNLDIAA